MQPKCLIIDEMDGIVANVVRMLIKQDIHRPVLCLANNLFAPALRELRQFSGTHVIHAPPIPQQRLLSRLEQVTEQEKLYVDRGSLAELVHHSRGDIRCCLNTLQFLRRNEHPGGSAGTTTAKDMQRLLKALSSKDTTLGLWDLWNDIFHRKEKSKYIAAMHREGEPPAEVGRAQRKVMSSVDPGYIYVKSIVERCADTETLLAGLYQSYPHQNYPDITFDRTCRCIGRVSFHDVVAAQCFQQPQAAGNSFALAEANGLITASAFFVECSSVARSGSIQFPQEAATAATMEKSAAAASAAFLTGVRVDLAPSYLSAGTFAVDSAALLTRCLVSRQIRFPTHNFAISTLVGRDRDLVLQSCRRHAEYGLSYGRQVASEILTLRGELLEKNSKWKHHRSERRNEETWVLVPEIYLVGGTTLHATGERTGATQPVNACLSLKDDIKQILVGEINAVHIQRRHEHFTAKEIPIAIRSDAAESASLKTHSAFIAQSSSKTMPGTASTPYAVPSSTKHLVASPAKNAKAPIKKDFFGRPIVVTSHLHSPHAVPQPQYSIKYIYFDGATNAVKKPAVMEDFL
jgi:chromosome transmission fidelity protein 18